MTAASIENDVDLERLWGEPPVECEVLRNNVKCTKPAAWEFFSLCQCGQYNWCKMCQPCYNELSDPAVKFQCNFCDAVLDANWRPL